MRWKPNPMLGQGAYEPFDGDLSIANAAVRAAAVGFWQAITQGEQFWAEFRKLAAGMRAQFG